MSKLRNAAQLALDALTHKAGFWSFRELRRRKLDKNAIEALREALQEYSETTAQRDALDAARYRWLRSTTNFVTSGNERIDVRNQPELWDEVIDAALAQKSQGDSQ